jgi:hypothetical protein
MKNKSIFDFNTYELEQALGRIKDLEAQVDRMMLDDNAKS